METDNGVFDKCADVGGTAFGCDEFIILLLIPGAIKPAGI